MQGRQGRALLGIQRMVGGGLFSHFLHSSDMKNAWNISQEQIYLHGSEESPSPGCSRNTMQLKAAWRSATDGGGGLEKKRSAGASAHVSISIPITADGG